MSVLSILYGQNQVIINDQSTGTKGILAKATKKVRQSLGIVTGIVVDATVNEDHSFKSDVTNNPIEDGAAAADHINLKPTVLTIEGVVSDAPLGFAIVSNVRNITQRISELLGKTSRSKDVFNAMIDLRNKKLPFTVVTNLKRYDNMVFTELSFPIDTNTGRAIKFKATMQQVSLVKSKLLDSSLSTDFAPLLKGQKDFGQKVTDPVRAGSKVTGDAERGESMFSSGTGWGT